MVTSEASPRPSDRDVSLIDRIASHARRSPERLALLSATSSMTYGEFERRSNQVAAALKSMGVRPGDYVGIHMHHVPEALVAFVGVLKSGAAYLPSDPEIPLARLEQLYREAEVKVVLADPRSASSLQGLSVKPRVLEPGVKSLDAWDAAAPAPVSPNSTAYLVYTSGSTGEPKGVFVPQRAMVNLCQAVVEAWKLTSESRVHLFVPLNFDAAGQTVFATLTAGATLVLRGETVPAPSEYTREIEQFGLTFLTLPPIYLHQWISDLARKGAKLPGTVRGVSLGGDKIALETRRLWREVGGAGIPWINDYGPTETTVTAMNHPCGDDPAAAELAFFPIGRPLPGVRVYVLDEKLSPVVKGEPGEMFIAGAGVSHGYLRRPAETAERFVPDPWSPAPGARMYRTGDLARELPDGTMLFLGRADDQVKIRGNRVELGEVELTLRRHPAIQEAVVAARPDSAGDLRLVGYWVSPQGEAPSERDLQKFLRERLPDYMVPGAWVRLEALPMTPNGKVDRRALPEPVVAPPPAAPAADSAGTSTGQLIERLCSEIIGSPVTLKDNFFDAGGNSLQAMQLLATLEEQLKAVVPLQVIFEAATLEDLAREYDMQRGDAQVDSMSSEELDKMLRQMQQTGS